MKITAWNGKQISKPGIYLGVPIDIYHSGSLCDVPALSSSGARRIFSDSPLKYWVYSPLNPHKLEEEPNKNFVLGRAAHHLALGETEFSKHFVIRPEQIGDEKWNGNRLTCKKWLADQMKLGRDVLTPADMETIHGMMGVLPWQAGLADCGLANNTLVQMGLLNGIVEATIAAKDPGTGFWLLARPDSIPVDSLTAGDLKTADSVDSHSLTGALATYRYDMQAAMIRLCLKLTADIELQSFALVFVQKKPPHSVVVREILKPAMDLADIDLRSAIAAFDRGMKTGKWPSLNGDSHDAEAINLPEWAINEARRRRDDLAQCNS
jgi:PDDEXK-like domain of unknown function (DUF3799)